MARRKRRAKKKIAMPIDPEMHKRMMKHKTLCLGAFLVLIGAFPLMGYRWEYVAILFGVIILFKGIFMKKCC